MSKSNLLYHPETQNLILIPTLVLLVPLIWWLIPGWNPGDLLSQHDNLQMGFIYQREFIRAGGDWEQLLYWPQLAGGVKVHDITGSPPFVQLLAYLGVEPVNISNSLVFFLQVLFSYFCTTITLRLSQLAYGNRAETPYLVLISLGALFAFLPMLGWRLSYGHDNLISGLFVFLCFTCLFLEEITEKRSITSLVLATLALCHSFQFNGYQMVHYSILFGAPIIIALMFASSGKSLVQRLRWYVIPATVFFGAFLISLPKFYGLLSNGLGTEMSRSGGSQVIYSYTTATMQDWISSLPWSRAYIPGSRPDFTHQEVNYPLGPVLLLLILIKPSIPLLRLFTGLGVSLLMALIASMNIESLSAAMISVVPMLESFRVPARAALPFLLFTSMLGLAVLVRLIAAREEPIDLQVKYWVLAAVSFALFSLTSPQLNDGLLVLSILVIFVLNGMHRLPPTPLVVAMLSIFSGAAVSAFNERAISPMKNPISETSVSSIRAEVLKQVPELASPLNRVATNIQLKGVGFNSVYFLDLSSLTAYWFPFRRYAQLVAELDHEHFNSAVSVFHNHSQRKGFTVLNRLYNVGWSIAFEAGQPIVNKLPETWGAAWISVEVKWQESIAELATSLNSQNDKKSLLLLSNDVKAGAAQVTGLPCTILSEPEIVHANFPIQLKLSTRGQCWLTVATNYSAILEAKDQKGRALSTFPAYGALLGVVLQENTTGVNITPIKTELPASSLILMSGYLILFLLVLFVLKYHLKYPLKYRAKLNTSHF